MNLLLVIFIVGALINEFIDDWGLYVESCIGARLPHGNGRYGPFAVQRNGDLLHA